MMEKINITVEKSTRMVNFTKRVIGNDLENLQQELVFKFTDEFVDGSARLEYKVDNNKYHIPMTKEGESYTVPVKNVITREGEIPMQLVVVQTEIDEEIPVFKSNVFKLYCGKSINAQEEAPDNYEYWLDVIEEKIAEMDNIDIDIQTVGDNTEVIITRKDGTTKEAIVSGGGGVSDVKVNNTSVVSDGIANIDLTGYVQDGNYVHTDNNYTTNEKTKLANLSNYDDTEVRELINEVADDIPTKTSDLTNDSGFITIETDPVFRQSPASGITSNDISNWNGKQDKLTSANAGNNVTITEVGGVVKINSTGGGSGGTSDYDQLSNRPSINNVTLTGNKSLNDLGIINFSGDYADLTNKPTIPTDTNDLTNGAGFITGISGSDVTNALGYTPYNSSNPNGYTSNTGTITGITMNGTSKGTSGVVDLGTVVTDKSDKQDTLVSGTNIKTINNQSLLGSGNINISGGGSSTDVQVNGVSIVSNDVANLLTKTAYDAETNKLATESDLFSGDYDDLTDKPKINNIPISGNKTAQMYGIQPAGNYATNPTVTTNQINATYSFTLNNNTEYRNTIDMTSITLNLPSTIDTDYCSWLVFPSGSTATSLTYPNTILWSGDDVSNNTFVPVSDKTYNVCFWYDSINVNAVVRGA